MKKSDYSESFNEQKSHYSFIESSALYKSKPKKKHIEYPSNNNVGFCTPCPTKKSVSFFSKISNLFCCTISSKPSSTERKNKDNLTDEKTPKNTSIVSKQELINNENDENSFYNKNFEKNGSEFSEMNLLFSKKKKLKMKYATNSIFHLKNYIKNKLFGYPENTLFFIKSQSKSQYMIVKYKILEFFSDNEFGLSDNNSNRSDNKSKIIQSPFDSALSDKDSKKTIKHVTTNLEKNPKKSCLLIRNNESTNEFIMNQDDKNIKNTHKCIHNIFDKKIKIDSEHWELITPEKVAMKISNRSRNYNIILDVFTGIGINAIEFGKEGSTVIALNSNLKSLKHAVYNSKVFGVEDKVCFINADFMNIKKEKMIADLIFINPGYQREHLNSKFSIYNHMNIDLKECLKKSFLIKDNIILCLPKYANLEEIVELFYESLTELNLNFDKKSLEIEYVFLNKELHQIIIYCGEISNISAEDELSFILSSVNENGQKDDSNIIEMILSKIGKQKTCEAIIKSQTTRKSSEALLQKTIDTLVNDNYITIQDIENFVTNNNFLSNSLDSLSKPLKNEEDKEDFAKKEASLLLNLDKPHSINKFSFAYKATKIESEFFKPIINEERKITDNYEENIAYSPSVYSDVDIINSHLEAEILQEKYLPGQESTNHCDLFESMRRKGSDNIAICKLNANPHLSDNSRAKKEKEEKKNDYNHKCVNFFDFV